MQMLFVNKTKHVRTYTYLGEKFTFLPFTYRTLRHNLKSAIWKLHLNN